MYIILADIVGFILTLQGDLFGTALKKLIVVLHALDMALSWLIHGHATAVMHRRGFVTLLPWQPLLSFLTRDPSWEPVVARGC